MASLNPESIFQSWILSPEETAVGSILSALQRQCIQNQICSLASEKTLLVFDPSNVQSYIQREAELQGGIRALQYLLTLSAEAEKAYDPGLQQIVIASPSSTDSNTSSF